MAHGNEVASSSNASFVRPEKFYITGFTDIPHIRYFYVFLCFVYVVTVLGNVFLLTLVYRVKTLHTPKYLIVCNLAVADLCESTAFIPKVLDTFLSNNRYILYEACLSYMFFIYFFSSLQSWTLVTMAYDRLIAICCPLRYHSLVTKQSLAVMLLLIWGFILCLLIYIVYLTDRLYFCDSLVINSMFCDHSPTYKLACNDTSLNNIMAYVCFIIFMCVPIIFITATYFCIAMALIRISSTQERLKAMRTCTSHLILVSIFFLPLLSTNIASVAVFIHPNTRMLNSSLTHTIPAMLNPIIYSLKTEEVLGAIKNVWKRRAVGKMKVDKDLTNHQ